MNCGSCRENGGRGAGVVDISLILALPWILVNIFHQQIRVIQNLGCYSVSDI